MMELGNLYLNEKGIDSAPTNFNKRITSTAQNQRTSFTRGSSQEMDRHAITAKFSKRGWLLKEGDNRPFFSFYEGSQDWHRKPDFNKRFLFIFLVLYIVEKRSARVAVNTYHIEIISDVKILSLFTICPEEKPTIDCDSRTWEMVVNI